MQPGVLTLLQGCHLDFKLPGFMQLEGREYPLGFNFLWFAMKVARVMLIAAREHAPAHSDSPVTGNV